MNLKSSRIQPLRSFFGVRDGAPPVAATIPAATELREVAQMEADAVIAYLDTAQDGLLEREARARLARYGANAVAVDTRKGPLRRLLELFATPLSLLLLSLAILAELTGEVRGAIVITLMVTSFSICMVSMWLPFSHFFADALGFTPLPHGYWLALAAMLLAYLTLTQLMKTWLIRRFGLS